MFAVAFGGEDDILRGGQQAQAGDGQFARDDDDRHPGREPFEFHKSDERGANHDLVRERVHENAEVGDEIAPARDLAVEEITDTRGDEEGKGYGLAIGQGRKNDGKKPSREGEAGQRQFIRQIHRGVLAESGAKSKRETWDVVRIAWCVNSELCHVSKSYAGSAIKS